MCSIQYTPSAVTSGDAFNLGNNGGAGTFASVSFLEINFNNFKSVAK